MLCCSNVFVLTDCITTSYTLVHMFTFVAAIFTYVITETMLACYTIFIDVANHRSTTTKIFICSVKCMLCCSDVFVLTDCLATSYTLVHMFTLIATLSTLIITKAVVRLSGLLINVTNYCSTTAKIFICSIVSMSGTSNVNIFLYGITTCHTFVYMLTLITTLSTLIVTKGMVFSRFPFVNISKHLTTTAKIFICNYTSVLCCGNAFVVFHLLTTHNTNMFMCCKASSRTHIEQSYYYQENTKKFCEEFFHSYSSFLLFVFYLLSLKKKRVLYALLFNPFSQDFCVAILCFQIMHYFQ